MSENTVLVILNKTVAFFKLKGIEEARLDAQILLSECLNINRIELYIQFERPLTIVELNDFREMVHRRSKREPIQKILGFSNFRYGKFKVDGRCLIPRKETELLVDLTLAKIKEKINPEMLEIGVGSGVIIISLLKEYPGTISIEGCDIDSFALDLTVENALLNKIKKPRLRKSNLFSAFDDDKKWDIIVSNPPYLSKKEYEELEPEVKNWDPYQALVGGETGLECIICLLEGSFSHLKEQGWLLLEVGAEQAGSVVEIGKKLGYSHSIISLDYIKKQRFVLLQK